MPDCFMQAIVAIESPSMVPCVAVHSVKGEGRKKRWFSCITRDSITRPCNTPIILLSPNEELLDSIQITTFSSFSASEAFKVTQTFPTILAGTSKPRENCENKSSKMYFSLIYSTMNRIIELWELETLDHGCTLVMIPQGSPKQMYTEFFRTVQVSKEPGIDLLTGWNTNEGSWPSIYYIKSKKF